MYIIHLCIFLSLSFFFYIYLYIYIYYVLFLSLSLTHTHAVSTFKALSRRLRRSHVNTRKPVLHVLMT